jgi:hypothetical protein
LPGSVQIPTELIQATGETLLSAIHKLINSIWNMEELLDQWKESIIVPVYEKAIKLTAIIVMGCYCYQLQTKFYPVSSQGYPYIDEIIEDHQCGF